MLGLPLYSISRTCPACNKVLLDIYGDHSLICGSGSERTNRHKCVRDTLYHIMNSAGLSPSLETANLIPDTIRRPADVSVNNWSLGKSAAIDVSITSPLQNTTILSATIEAGFAAGEREKSKDENIFNNCHDAGIIFLPFVVETLGTWGQTAKDIMENNYKSLNWIYQKLSVAIHRGNANMIISRSPIVEFYS